MTQKEITVLMVEPGKHPKVTTLKDDLESLQKAVSIGADYQGLIEFVSLGNGDCTMCNEEGKLIGLDGNRRLGDDSKAYNCSFLMSGRPLVVQTQNKTCFCQSIEARTDLVTWLQVPPRAPKEKQTERSAFSFGAAIFALGKYNLADTVGINIAFAQQKYHSGEAGISLK